MMGRGRKPKPLSDAEKFCICGWLATGDSVTAYRLSHDSKSDNYGSLQRMASEWLRRADVMEYVENRRRADFKAFRQSDKGIVPTERKTRSKEDVVAELNALIDAETDFKRKADYLMKLAEIQRMKQVEETEKERQVSFYVPLRFEQCREMYVYELAKVFGWDDEQKETALGVILANDAQK